MNVEPCRFCKVPLHTSFCDLGMSPLANSYLDASQLQQAERFYPLHAFVCDRCYLVQLKEFESPEAIFSDYAYFSSYSDSWLEAAKSYTAYMRGRFGFNHQSLVVEIASNDGYLLQYFQKDGIPVLGIEPAENVARVAQAAGIDTVVRFFGRKTAEDLAASGRQADLLVANNVLAHVPDLNDFVAGMKVILGKTGMISVEFPHLMRLIEHNQFDTIYHEHFSYLSLLTVQKVFAHHGLTLFDVQELTTHGGSLRLFGCHAGDTSKDVTQAVSELANREREAGLDRMQTYTDFAEKVKRTKRGLLQFLSGLKDEGKTIAGYGAPAKGNTLLNYCGIGADFLDYTVDRSPHKQGKFLPGTHIPIYSPEKLQETKPDYLLILPWNLQQEIMQQTAFIRQWNGKFIVPIPSVEVLA